MNNSFVPQEGPFTHEMGVSALAAVTKCNIVTVEETVAYLHPATPGAYKQAGRRGSEPTVRTTFAGVCINIFEHNTDTGIPDVVFERDTVVLCYSGKHFWYTAPIEDFDSSALKRSWGEERTFKVDLEPGKIFPADIRSTLDIPASPLSGQD